MLNPYYERSLRTVQSFQKLTARTLSSYSALRAARRFITLRVCTSVSLYAENNNNTKNFHTTVEQLSRDEPKHSTARSSGQPPRRLFEINCQYSTRRLPTSYNSQNCCRSPSTRLHGLNAPIHTFFSIL